MPNKNIFDRIMMIDWDWVDYPNTMSFGFIAVGGSDEVQTPPEMA